MNLRRGLFRLWIVGSALFVLAVPFVSYSEIKKQFDDDRFKLVVPQFCGKARGVAGTDYTQFRKEGPGPWDTIAKPNPFHGNCWYTISKFRPLYPEYKDVSDKELSNKLYAEHGGLSTGGSAP